MRNHVRCLLCGVCHTVVCVRACMRWGVCDVVCVFVYLYVVMCVVRLCGVSKFYVSHISNTTGPGK